MPKLACVGSLAVWLAVFAGINRNNWASKLNKITRLQVGTWSHVHRVCFFKASSDKPKTQFSLEWNILHSFYSFSCYAQCMGKDRMMSGRHVDITKSWLESYFHIWLAWGSTQHAALWFEGSSRISEDILLLGVVPFLSMGRGYKLSARDLGFGLPWSNKSPWENKTSLPVIFLKMKIINNDLFLITSILKMELWPQEEFEPIRISKLGMSKCPSFHFITVPLRNLLCLPSKLMW